MVDYLKKALICRPEPCQPSHQYTALRKSQQPRCKQRSINLPALQCATHLQCVGIDPRGSRQISAQGAATWLVARGNKRKLNTTKPADARHLPWGARVHKEMAPALSQLEPSDWPAHSPLRRAADTISVNL